MTEMASIPQEDQQLFWSKVARGSDSQCWEWQGAKNHLGYGSFRRAGFSAAHRFSYTVAKGTIPDRLVIDHLCRNPSCVNPAHLEAVTNSINTLRGTSGLRGKPLFANKEHVCRNGHVRTPENTYVRPNGQRECRDCNTIRMYGERRAERQGQAIADELLVEHLMLKTGYDLEKVATRAAARIAELARLDPLPAVLAASLTHSGTAATIGGERA